jgi:hypothetical protein
MPLRDAFSAWRKFVRARALLRVWRSPMPHRTAGDVVTVLSLEDLKWRQLDHVPDEDEEEPRSLVVSATTSPTSD